MSCFQCDLDIPHVCYAGMPNARWGWTDEAVAHLKAAQRNGFMGGMAPREQQRAPTKPRTTKPRRTR